MNITVPVYVERRLGSSSDGVGYRVQPLFFPTLEERGDHLERVLDRMAAALRDHLHSLGRQGRHDELARWTFCPDLKQHRIEVSLELRRRTIKATFLFVACKKFGRTLAFTPSVPDLWFDVEKGERLAARAEQVLTAHFRQKEKDDDDAATPEQASLSGKAWVTALDLIIQPTRRLKKSEETRFALLGQQEVLDGDTELRRVGRCLDRLYPSDLDRVLLREREVAELTRLLKAEDRRPVLLLGPRQAGKTALLHEFVFQSVQSRPLKKQDRGNLWLIAPQRLISGMSYVGQWENRLLAILKEARRREHILYFDDLLGLFQAGVSRDANLSVARVLKPYLERREVRVVAEIAPEAFRVLREQDRAFADLFHPLPIREPSDDETLRILLGILRRLEGKHRCRFQLDVLPAVLDLTRRHRHGVAYSGKAAGFLERLAIKHRRAEVGREQVLEEFRATSGLTLPFLDGRTRLEREDVQKALEAHLVGQPEAVVAVADAVSIAKARLNDPERPLASFLFLGPTGVGKTQTAKALANYLFGDGDRLVRFDMNECVDAAAAARLVGTFGQPDGLLTSAVRRQPFCVLLLDEIEKAHPDVHDLLLQVLGEGRLTDALGRTADFTSAIIVLTSNLGSREAEGGLGFRHDAAFERAVYIQAAEKFFRPEFFNRLDRVVPFNRLSRDDVRSIAGRLIEEVLQREGLVRRRCLLQVEPEALERIVDLGYDPLMGARALKRELERRLTRPIADRLAAGLPETVTVITLYPGPDLIAVSVRSLEETPRQSESAKPSEDAVPILQRAEAVRKRIEAQFATLRPDRELGHAEYDPRHWHYVAVRQQIQQLRELIGQVRDQRELARRPIVPGSAFGRANARRKKIIVVRRWKTAVNPQFRQAAGAEDTRQHFRDLTAAARPLADRDADLLTRLAQQAALVQLVADSCTQPQLDQALLWLRSPREAGQTWLRHLADGYKAAFGEALGLDVVRAGPNERPTVERLVVRGPHVLALLAGEEGTHLIYPAHGPLLPLQVLVLPFSDEEGASRVESDLLQKRQEWLELMTRREAAVDDDPWRLGPVVRIYDEGGRTLDLRTGLVVESMPSGEDIQAFHLAALPLPREWSD